MGLLNRIFGAEESGEEDDGFEDDEFLEDDEEFGEFEGDDEFGEIDEQQQEWDTAYQFCGDALEARGFSSVKEFIQKAMVYRINRSPLFRDRVKVGNETMHMVSDTMAEMNQMGGKKGTDYEELAGELEAANKLMEEVDKFSNEEDQMVWQLTGILNDFVDAYSERQSGGGGGISSGVSKSEEEL